MIERFLSLIMKYEIMPKFLKFNQLIMKYFLQILIWGSYLGFPLAFHGGPF